MQIRSMGPTVVLGILVYAGICGADIRTARQADSFVESMGTAVHVRYIAGTPTYHQIVKPAIVELGIRHLRDGGQGTAFLQNVKELHDLCGVKWAMVCDPRDQITPGNVLSVYSTVIGAIDALEGPNEWDILGDLKYKEKTFPEGVRLYQQELYGAIKISAIPATRNIKVLTPTMAFGGNAVKLGPVPADFAAMHPYPGGTSNLPDNGLDRNIGYARAMLDTATKSVIATETGYCNTLTTSGCTNQGGVTERAAAKYAGRMYAEYFLRGVARTYLYNLSTDDWSMFLRSNGEKKPAFHAIKRLIALLGDPGSPFVPKALFHTITSTEPSLKSIILQKRNGTFYLLMWLNKLSVTSTYAEVETSRSVNITFNQPVTRARVFNPTFGDTTATDSFVSPTTLSISVPDYLTVLEIVPEQHTDVTAPAAPVVHGTAGLQHVALTWTAPSDNKGVAGYIVNRNGVQIGTSTHTAYTDSGLPVSTLFRYTVCAVDSAGNVSPSSAPLDIATQRIAVPGKVEAELYSRAGDVGTKGTSDEGGSGIVAWTHGGDWLEYELAVASAGLYKVGFRLATPIDSVPIEVRIDTVLAGTVLVRSTGGWGKYATQFDTISVPQGNHVLRIVFGKEGFDFNYMTFSALATSTETELLRRPASTQQSLYKPLAQRDYVNLQGKRAGRAAALTRRVRSRLLRIDALTDK